MSPGRPPLPAPAIGFDDVLAAAARLEGHAHRTPVMTSSTANALTGAQLYFKCENLQRVGAFKFRGAYNAIANLSAADKARGVITYSSGNHAQAIALSARLLDTAAVIVMPADAPAVKIAATRGYGAQVVTYDRLSERREDVTDALVRSRGLTLVPPFDHRDVIAGQGTAALELFREVGELDHLVVCVGGGGLISGCAIAANGCAPSCNVIGVEPQDGDDATRSFRSGELQHSDTAHLTIADGARTPSLGELTFPLLMNYVHDMQTVSDDDLVWTMRFMLERMKLLVEPTGALAAATLLRGRIRLPGARVGVIVSGGNIDLADLARLLAAAPAADSVREAS